VDDARHRILILAERTTYDLAFPYVAFFATSAGANGQGLSVGIDPGQSTPLPMDDGNAVPAYYNGDFGKGVDPQDPRVIENPEGGYTFESFVPDGMMSALASVAQANDTYFTTAGDAETFLASADAPGSVVFVDLTALGAGTVTMGGNYQIGTLTDPVVLVLLGAEGLVIDWRGTADFFGVVVADADAMNRGTCTFHGSVLCSGTLEGKGNGSEPDLSYNGDLIAQINQDYTMSVHIVPGSWEEYTIPE
jgi:hypothetical protein